MSAGRPPSAPEASGRRVDGSMPLLNDVMTNTLDEAYAERSARRTQEAGSGPRRAGGSRGRVRAAVLVGLVLLGLLTGTAVQQVRDRAEASAGLRDDLADEVVQRGAVSDRLAAEAAALRAEVAATRDAALGADAAGRAAAERVRALELAAGTTAVTGPGVVLTVDDAPPEEGAATTPELRGGTPDVSRVNDRDLQSIVNGLWAAGAEAVAVNGVRLSSRSPVRSAGEAILVDFEPLGPPYAVEAVGRPADLEVGFVDGAAGRGLQALSQLTGITWSLERRDELSLPAATEPALRAVVLEEP